MRQEEICKGQDQGGPPRARILGFLSLSSFIFPFCLLTLSYQTIGLKTEVKFVVQKDNTWMVPNTNLKGQS